MQILAKIKKNAQKYPIPNSSGREDKYHEYVTKKDFWSLKHIQQSVICK